MTKAPFLVVFDVDGTLVDSQDHICAAMSAAFSAVGLPEPPRARVLSIVGLSLPQAVATLAPDLAPAVQARIVAAYKASFMPQSGAKPSPLFPGALAALDSLAGRGDVILAVATGKSRRYNTPGSFDVTLIATNSSGSDTLTLNNYILVYPLFLIPKLCILVSY